MQNARFASSRRTSKKTSYITRRIVMEFFRAILLIRHSSHVMRFRGPHRERRRRSARRRARRRKLRRRWRRAGRGRTPLRPAVPGIQRGNVWRVGRSYSFTIRRKENPRGDGANALFDRKCSPALNYRSGCTRRPTLPTCNSPARRR